jgi:hypothetical protein
MIFLKKLISLTILAVLTTLTYSQTNTFYFAKNENLLSDSVKTQLDIFYTAYLTSNNPEVIIKGYSDTVGTSEVNLNLSQQRVNSVKDYLQAKGYPTDKISLKYFGESRINEDLAWQNRRVDLFINPKLSVYDYLQEFQKTIQEFQINNTNDTVIKGKEGTIIYIPKDCFITDNNKQVKSVKFSLNEHYNFEDILTNNLTTITENGELLETAGMILINADSDGKECRIKNGQSILISFSGNLLSTNEYDLYSGIQKNKNIIWQKSSRKQLSEVAIVRTGPRHHKYRSSFISNELDTLFKIEIDSSIFFPLDAYKQGICGKNTIFFKVDSKGQISQPFIKEDERLHPSIDNLTLNLIRNLPPIIPLYKKDKKALKFVYSETFTFYSDNCKQGMKRYKLGELKSRPYFLGNIISKSIDDSKIEINDINSVTSAFYSTNTLGWKNCDRLTLLNTKTVSIKVNQPYSHNIDFKIFLKNRKVVVPLISHKNQYVSDKLPEGEDILLIGIKYDGNNIYWSKNELTAVNTEINDISFIKVTASELKKILNEYKK